MGYSSNIGWQSASFEEIETFYLQQVNTTFGTTYDLSSFRGSGFWQIFLGAMEKDREIENKIGDLLSQIQDEINNLQADFFYAQAGLFKGVRASLLTLDSITDVSLFSNPTDDYYRGRLGIAIQYSDSKLQTDDTTTELIADTIVNNIGAGIWAYVDSETVPQDIETSGVLKENKQSIRVSWKFAVLQPVILKITYKRTYGMDIPASDTIKTLILSSVEKKYQFGERFTPDSIARGCDFDFWREAKVSYSLDNGKTYQDKEFMPNYWVKLTFSAGDSIILENGDSQ